MGDQRWVELWEEPPASTTPAPPVGGVESNDLQTHVYSPRPCVARLHGEKLRPCAELWGRVPGGDMLGGARGKAQVEGRSG